MQKHKRTKFSKNKERSANDSSWCFYSFHTHRYFLIIFVITGFTPRRRIWVNRRTTWWVKMPSLWYCLNFLFVDVDFRPCVVNSVKPTSAKNDKCEYTKCVFLLDRQHMLSFLLVKNRFTTVSFSSKLLLENEKKLCNNFAQ